MCVSNQDHDHDHDIDHDYHLDQDHDQNVEARPAQHQYFHKLFAICLLETVQVVFLLATASGFLTMTDIQQRPSQAKLQLISNAALR